MHRPVGAIPVKANPQYAEIRVALEKSGTPIGLNDLLIAAHCLLHKALIPRGIFKKELTERKFKPMIRLVSAKSFINSILHAVLMLSVILVYGGGATAIEMEHEHSDAHAELSSSSPHHHHHHHDDDNDGSDHHDRGDHPDEGEEPPEEGDSSPHRHSHVLAIDMHAVSTQAKVPFPKMAFRTGRKRVPFGELCPDGPYFELSKPPQLG